MPEIEIKGENKISFEVKSVEKLRGDRINIDKKSEI